MPERDDDDKPKRSWREIDALRDKSSQREQTAPRGDRPFGGGKRGEARQKTYRSQLDRLFDAGGIGKLVAQTEKQGAAASPGEDSRLKRLAAVRDAVGAGEITRAIDTYLKAFPWPDELEFLSAALEHRDQEVVAEALARLQTALAAGKPRRSATLAGRLRALEELSTEAEIRSRAAALRAKL